MMMSPTPSGQPADVGDDSERRGGPDGLRSAPHSNGRLGGHWLGPDSKHTAVEVSLRSSQSSGPARDEATGGANYTLCCTRLWWGWKLVPAPITDQPSEHETCISLYFFSYSLYLSLFLSIVWVNRESSRITAWQFLPIIWFFWIITFIFLFWKKMKTTLQLQGNNTPLQRDKIDINISEKLQDQLHKLLLYHCIIIRL